MPLLTVPIVKNSHIWARLYFIYLKTRPERNLEVSKQIWTSAETLQKQLPSKAKLSTFLHLNFPNFRLKPCKSS